MHDRRPALRAVPQPRPAAPGETSAALVDEQAERAVLGAMLLADEQAPAVYEAARRVVRCRRVRGVNGVWDYRGDFFEPRHNVLFACMGQVIERGDRLDIITLAAELRRARGYEDEHGLLNTVGGVQYLGDLYETLPTWAHVESHARIVADLAAARRMLEACESSAADLRARGPAALRDCLARVAEARTERRGKAARRMSDVVESAWDQVAETLAGRRAPVPTGFAALDGDEHGLGHFAGGLHRGELVVVTADQGGGKTAWVLQIALHAARQGRSVLVISQEMSAEALYWRLACADAKVDSGLLRSGRLSQDDVTALQAASRGYVNLDLRVVDCGCNVDDIRTAALSVAATGPLHLVVVDYLQILDAPEDAPDKAHEVVDANALAMKKLARELDAPVVLLSQFNRSAQTTPRKPRIQDLKGSGGIESHADVIVALWPEGGRRDGPMPAELPVEGLILKNRNGPTEAFPMVFERALTRFREVVKRTEGAVPPSYPDDLPEGMPAAAPGDGCAP